MTMRLGKIFIFVAALVLADAAWAVRYELEEGQQYALCRDYVKALNAADRELPMACERRFPPEFEKFSKPKWEPMKPKTQSMSFYRQVYDIRMRVLDKDKNTDKTWLLAKERTYEPALEKDLIELAKARVDIDASGDSETLIRVRVRLGAGGCEAETDDWFREGRGPMPNEFRYYVLDQETGKLDARYGTIALVGGTQGLFYYEGRTYLDSFTGISVKRKLEKAAKFQFRTREDPEGHISIGEPGGGSRDSFGTRWVCKINVFYEMDE